MDEEQNNLKKTFVITLGEQNIDLPGYTKQNELITHKRFLRWKKSKINDLDFYLAKDTRLENNEEAAQKHGFSLDLRPEYRGFFEHEQGAVGCFVSHWGVWQKISRMKQLQQTDYFLILEDDVYMDNVKHFIENFEDLSIDMFKNSKGKDEEARIIALHYRREHGSEAYLINQAGAKLLLSNVDNMTISMPADKYIWNLNKDKHPTCFWEYPCIWVDRDFCNILSSHPDYEVEKRSQDLEEKHQFMQKIQNTVKLKKYQNRCPLKELMDKGLLTSETINILNEFLYRPPEHYVEAFYSQEGEVVLCPTGTIPPDKQRVFSVP